MNYEVSLKERKGMLYAHYYEGSKLIKKSLKLKATKQNIAYVQKQIIPSLQGKTAKGEKLFMENKISVFFEKVMRRTESKAPSTRCGYQKGIEHFLKYFSDRDIKTITVLEMDDYIEYLAKKISSASIRLYLMPISMAFNEAIRYQMLTINPVKYAIKPRMVHKERRVYTITQVFRLLEAASNDLKTFLHIGFFTGMRVGEIIALNWEDINFDKKTISVTKSRSDLHGIGKTKSGKNRKVHIINKLEKYLLSIKKDTGNIFDRTYTYYSLRFKALCKELNFFYEGTHNMRHTFASLMLQAKENPLLVKEFLGHNNLTMINTVYAHYIEDKQDCAKFGAILEQYSS